MARCLALMLSAVQVAGLLSRCCALSGDTPRTWSGRQANHDASDVRGLLPSRSVRHGAGRPVG